jgi:small subunit ribosomal protein S17
MGDISTNNTISSEKTTGDKQTSGVARRPGKTFLGTVLSSKMQESAIVVVTDFVKHPRYGKYIKKRKKYLVHNPDNRHKEGEKVTIVSTRPLSKRKHFTIV